MTAATLATLGWIPVALFAALAQTGRNAAQKSLTASLGTWPATLVRFLFGLPFALACLAALYLLPGRAAPWPHFTWAYIGWVALGAAFQLAATAALLRAMQERNFAVAVTLSKTEVLQVALFGVLFLAEWPTVAMVGAMLVATLGVGLLSLPPGRRLGAAWWSPSAGYGLLCGACFAIASVGYRGAALALGIDSPLLSAAWGVTLAQTLQTLGLGAWIAWRSPEGLAPIWRAWRVSLMAGSLGAIASLAWFAAYAMQGIAAVRTVGMAEVLFSLLVAHRLLRERLGRAETLGMALVVLGIVLLCLQYV
ncbi:DMT family transporter [Ottowia sp.]|uniref:DMT family transporter n=1 Tax=Ottowia sp. TaxID=1898956 RepID=UPI0039E6818A